MLIFDYLYLIILCFIYRFFFVSQKVVAPKKSFAEIVWWFLKIFLRQC